MSTRKSDGKITLPDGRVILPDGAALGTVIPDGSIKKERRITPSEF